MTGVRQRLVWHRNISWTPSSLNMADKAASPLVSAHSCCTCSTTFEPRFFGMVGSQPGILIGLCIPFQNLSRGYQRWVQHLQKVV